MALQQGDREPSEPTQVVGQGLSPFGEGRPEKPPEALALLDGEEAFLYVEVFDGEARTGRMRWRSTRGEWDIDGGSWPTAYLELLRDHIEHIATTGVVPDTMRIVRG